MSNRLRLAELARVHREYGAIPRWWEILFCAVVGFAFGFWVLF